MAHPTPGPEPKSGLTCETCGEYEKFPAYVYAHWHEPLTYTCKVCGSRYEIEAGVITQLEKGHD